MRFALAFCWLWFASMALHPAFCQLDTLYVDHFVDNRHNWETSNHETKTCIIRDGFLDVSIRQRKGSYQLSTFGADVTASDSFVYEMRILVDSAHTVGPAYLINFKKPRKNGTKLLCCYQAVVANPKDVHSYVFQRGDGGPAFNWAPKGMDLDRHDITFRLTYGPSGLVHYFWNGQRIHSTKIRLYKKHPLWQQWGFVARGNSKFKVDYLYVLARPKTGA